MKNKIIFFIQSRDKLESLTIQESDSKILEETDSEILKDIQDRMKEEHENDNKDISPRNLKPSED